MLSVISVLSCSQAELTDINDEEQAFFMKASSSITKTAFVDSKLEWNENDAIGLFIGDKIANKKFTCIESDKTSATFKGYYVPIESINSASLFAYYPFSARAYNNGKLNLSLPENQVAPYDPNADFTLAGEVRDYDQETPNLNMSFDNHIFSIIKIAFTNSDDKYADEDICGVEIIAPEGSVLTGDFSIDIDKNATPKFSAENTSEKVVVNFPDGDRPKLGKGQTHYVYAVVNAGSYQQLRIVLHCSEYKSTFTSSGNISLESNKIYNVSGTFDFASGAHGKSHRTLLYWGDSIANEVVTSYLQTLLGDYWTVVRGGIGGDSPLGIAGRQGSIPLVFKDDFVIPGDGSQVEMRSLYSSWTTNGEPGNITPKVSFDGWFMYESSLLNNCYVGKDKIECKIERNFQEQKAYISRVSEGEDVNVTAGTVFYSNASQTYTHPDVTCVYMGANRGYNDSNAALARMYEQMRTYAPDEFGKYNFIAIGYHMGHIQFSSSYEYTYWTEDYRNCFQEKFGDQYLDLKTIGAQNAERISKSVGSGFTEEDKTLSESGNWPSSWQTDYRSNVHPNVYGSRAIAFMVYEKMKSLGYLD